MDIDNYQTEASTTAKYPEGRGLEYVVLGLASEAGEVAGKLKKIIRDNDGIVTDEHKEALLAEVGDVLWYCAMVALELDTALSRVARGNLDKLMSRNERGVIGGSGDTR